MILVTGAGGKTGKTLIRVLSRVESVCAFVHDEKQISGVKELGAHTVFAGDLRDQSIVRDAMRGVRKLYHICPNMNPDEVSIGRVVIDSARSAGIEQFIFHSVLHPQAEKMNHHRQKLLVEELLMESGLPFTILQPAPYMHNWLPRWNSIVDEGILRLPYSSHTQFSFVDLEDVAEAATIVLTEPNHLDMIYELSGTHPMSHAQVAKILSNVLNRPVKAEREEIQAWRSQNTGISDYVAENLINMFNYYDQFGLPGNPNVLKWLLKREPTTPAAFVERIVKERHAVV